MSNTGRPPTDDDALEFRRAQAELTHLALHRRMRAQPDGLLAFVKETIDHNGMVWIVWEESDAGFRWDIVEAGP